MKTKPIIFNGEMVRAILEGRKAQTRRVIKPQPPHLSRHAVYNDSGYGPDNGWYWGPYGGFAKCPYGKPGDRLWVRETWAHCQPILDIKKPDGRLITEMSDGYAAYRADGYETIVDYKEQVALTAGHEVVVRDDRWRPSIHMPRWASRITLEITGVRVERVREISEADARIEGPPDVHNKDWPTVAAYHPVDAFRHLWDSINGKKPGRAWDDNPWVWVIEFKRCNI